MKWMDEWEKWAPFADLPADQLPDGFPVNQLEISVRANNCAERAGCRTVGDVRDRSDTELRAVWNLGKLTLLELREVTGTKRAEEPQHVNEEQRQKTAEAEARCNAVWERKLAFKALRDEGLTYREIGARMGVSFERARQLVILAERKLASIT